jgi:WD40 repeat protein
MNVKLWDLRMPKPLFTAEVSEQMSKNIKDLQLSDAVDDQFFLSVSHDGKHLATGAYDKSAHVIDALGTSN